MHKKLLILSLIIIAMAGMAWAQLPGPVSMPGASAALLPGSVLPPRLTTSVISGGGGWSEWTDPSSGVIHRLFDIKCTPFSALLIKDTYALGADGVHPFCPPVAPGAWVTDPNVENLRILRSGSDILVEWDPVPPYTGPFYVYRLADKDFENASGRWLDGIDVGSDTSYPDPGQVGAGDEQVYYRVLSTPNKAALTDKVAVGKINITLDAKGIKLVSCSFNDGSVEDVFKDQIGMNESYKLYPQSGKGLDVVTVTEAGVRGQNFAIAPTVGFWLRNENAATKIITFCGNLEYPYHTPNFDIPELTGNPLPATLDSVRLGGRYGDYLYQQIGKGLNPMRKNRSWPRFSLKVGEGIWYRGRIDRRYWDVDVRNQKAIIQGR